MIESVTLPAVFLALTWRLLLEYYDAFEPALDFPLSRLSFLDPTSVVLASLVAVFHLPACLIPASLVPVDPFHASLVLISPALVAFVQTFLATSPAPASPAPVSLAPVSPAQASPVARWHDRLLESVNRQHCLSWCLLPPVLDPIADNYLSG